jgi:hypothetical protein
MMHRPVHVYYKNSPLHYLPEGSMALTKFAIICGVPQSVAMIHVLQGLGGEHLEVTKGMWKTRMCRYVTPEQQRKAFEFWDKHKVRYRRPVLAVQCEATL